MNRRTAHIRRQKTSVRLKKQLAVLALCGIAGCAAVLLPQQEGGQPPASQPGVQSAAPVASMSPPPALHGAARRVYPYSIVPGGVDGRSELARAVTSDKVVAAHYASFDVGRARPLAVAKARAVYVSYRKGDKVYWTANKLMLARGETLLSDGKSEIRGRCGNRISDLPMLPVEARGPSEEELDSSVAAADNDGSVVHTAFALGEGGDATGFTSQAHQLLAAGEGTASAQQGGTAPAVNGWTWPGPPTGGAVLLPVIQPTPGGSMTSTASLETGGDAGVRDTGDRPARSAPSSAPSPAPVALAEQVTDGGSPVVAGTEPPTLLPAALPWPPQLPAAGAPGNHPTPAGEAPEPASLWLGGLGLGLMLLRRRKPVFTQGT
jgi:hypothetical protein